MTTTLARRYLAAVFTAFALIVATAASSSATGAAPDRERPGSSATNKGPIGWETLRGLDDLPDLTRGVGTAQYSSFDRTGGNDDGFNGTYSCLRTTSAGCVIADRSGAGEIDSIWFTRDNGDVTKTGKITIELDGKTVLDANLQDVVDGKLGGAFVYPLVANADQSSGGVYIAVPMDYRHSMRITTTTNPLFYHVTHRTFADDSGVKTFDPAKVPSDILTRLSSWGSTDPKPPAGGNHESKRFALKPGHRVEVADLGGSGRINALNLKLPQAVSRPEVDKISDDGRAFTGSSTFKVAVDPANAGVTLTRRYDSFSHDQVARISVDGQDAGTWPASESTDDHQWRDQSVTLPASLTAGKSSITIKNTFVSASIDFNEFRYDVDSVVDGTKKRTDTLDVGPSDAGLASEKAHAYAIAGQTWSGTNNTTYERPPLSQDVLDSDALLRGLRLQVRFDGKLTVDSPVGEFFGSGLGQADVASLMYSMRPAAEGGYTSWWPMPYAHSAEVSLVNKSDVTVRSGTASVSYEHDRDAAHALGGRDPSEGYFHATSHRGDTVSGKDWVFLDAQGRGKFVGVNHTMVGKITSGNLRDYLEGDERVYVDGSRSPAIHGTGTEDFYQSGWYFNRDAYTNPFNGAPLMETANKACTYQCDSAYRLFVNDAVSFNSSLRFGIEHGPTATDPANYSSTAFWYGQGGKPAQRISDTLTVGDPRSERAHRYVGDGDVASTTSTFEGDQDGDPSTLTTRATTSPIRFDVKVDQRATGVTLRRVSDQKQGYQEAKVLVNGHQVGTWLQPLSNGTHRLLEDSFDVPAWVLGHGRTAHVELVPRTDTPWSAARYEVVSSVAPFTDRRAPERVTGVGATGDVSTDVAVSWEDSADDVGVRTYQVYGSTEPGVPVKGATKLGSTTGNTFVHHTGSPDERWYYRVVAVDAAGNRSRPSAVTGATSGRRVLIEGESLVPSAVATAPVEVQDNCCGVTFSGGSQLWFRATKAGDTATVTFDVAKAGHYDVSAILAQAGDYGIVSFSLDGTQIGSPFDGYASSVRLADPYELGSAMLSGGAHTLTMTMDAKNSAATGYLAGLDVLRLELAS